MKKLRFREINGHNQHNTIGMFKSWTWTQGIWCHVGSSYHGILSSTSQPACRLGSGQVGFMPLGGNSGLHGGPQAFPGLGTPLWVGDLGSLKTSWGTRSPPVWVPRASLSSGHQGWSGTFVTEEEVCGRPNSLDLISCLQSPCTEAGKKDWSGRICICILDLKQPLGTLHWSCCFEAETP